MAGLLRWTTTGARSRRGTWLLIALIVVSAGGAAAKGDEDDDRLPDLPPAKITCQSDPPGAEIWVGHPNARPQWRKGVTPAEISIESSTVLTTMEFRITFIMEGYDEASVVYPVRRGDTFSFSASLERTCKVAFVEGGVLVAQGYDGSHRRSLALVGEDARFGADRLSWSPTGRSLAYVSGGDIYTVDLDDAVPRRVTHVADGGDYVCDSPAWSPDAWWIAYRKLGLRTGESSLCLASLRRDAGEPVPLATNIAYAGEWLPMMAPRRLAAEASDGILVIDLDPTREFIARTQKIDGAGHPAWSPDGAMLAFVSGGQLYLADDMGANPRPVTQLATGRALTPRWSPHGAALCFLVRSQNAEGNERDDIYLLDSAGGGTAMRIGPGEGEPGAGECLDLIGFGPDGNSVLYQVEGAQRSAVWAIDPSSGRTSLVLKDATAPAWYGSPPNVRLRNFALFRQALVSGIDSQGIPDVLSLLADPVVVAESSAEEKSVTGDERRTLAARICQTLQPVLAEVLTSPMENGPAGCRMVLLAPAPAPRLYLRLEDAGWRVAYVRFEPEA